MKQHSIDEIEDIIRDLSDKNKISSDVWKSGHLKVYPVKNQNFNYIVSILCKRKLFLIRIQIKNMSPTTIQKVDAVYKSIVWDRKLNYRTVTAKLKSSGLYEFDQNFFDFTSPDKVEEIKDSIDNLLA